MKINEYNGEQLLAAVKVGKRNPEHFFAVCEEIDRRVTNRNAAGKLPTPPVQEALAILAKRGVDHVASTVGETTPEPEAVEAPAPKAKPELTPEQKARKRAIKAAEKAAAKLHKANGGKGYVTFVVRERKARLAKVEAKFAK